MNVFMPGDFSSGMSSCRVLFPRQLLHSTMVIFCSQDDYVASLFRGIGDLSSGTPAGRFLTFQAVVIYSSLNTYIA